MSINWDIEELAGYAMGKTEEQVETMVNNDEVHDLLEEKYGVDLETYCAIVVDIMPFAPKVKAGISGSEYHALVHPTEPRMIVKIKAGQSETQ